MVRLLVLDHRGVSVDSLVNVVRSLGATVDLVEPESIAGPLPVTGFDGFIASGGYLRSATHRATLLRYSVFFQDLEAPFLGVCLGMRILGHCYGARVGKIPPLIGEYRVSLRGFPLSPGLTDFAVHQNHKYQLLHPLPGSLEDFTSDGNQVQAVKVVGKSQYAVQFHPEVGESPAKVIFENFLSECAGSR